MAFVLFIAPEGVEATKAKKSFGAELYKGVKFAIFEEITIRGLFQNSLALIQKGASRVAPEFLRDNKVFQWITSPSMRIIAIASFFSYLHLFEAGASLSAKDTLFLMSTTMMLPIESILHETTGNIIAPIGSHMTFNVMAKTYNEIINDL